jgi:hypothetical protein
MSISPGGCRRKNIGSASKWQSAEMPHIKNANAVPKPEGQRRRIDLTLLPKYTYGLNEETNTYRMNGLVFGNRTALDVLRTFMMTDPDRVKLLFGPSRTPPFRCGQRVLCEARGLVVVCGLTDASIPWLVCRGIGKSSGRTSLVVFDDLAVAIRRESAQAVAHQWGVSDVTVSKWRRLLDVPQNNQGTLRLRREYAKEPGVKDGLRKAQARAQAPERRRKIAEARKDKPRPPGLMKTMHEANRGRKASAQTRRKQSEAHKSRGTWPPSAGRPWMPWEDALLGVVSDAEVAQRTGRTVVAVYRRRNKLRGIGGTA